MDLGKILRMSHLLYVLAEAEELPEDSDDLSTILKNIETLETYNARKKYAEQNLEHLSSGSSRIVYLTPEKTVVKLASNDKGIAQNKVEANPKMTSKCLNEILGHAKNYSWIETHFLEKITEKEFKEMTGTNFKDFGDAISYGLKKVSDESAKKPNDFDKVSKSDIYKEVKRIGEEFHLLPGDLSRISSWGRKDDRPILIDSGLSREVFDEFYED
jgi:hypothetical protein